MTPRHPTDARLPGLPAPTTPARRLFDDTDWAATALGDPATWSATLRATVTATLTSKFPMLVMGGDELVMVYNDAYAPMLGERHPAAMGRPLAEVWSDVWPTISPMIDAVRDDRDGNYLEDLMLVMTRHGFTEETYFTFSYSPVIDGAGDVVGVLDTAIETTGRVLGARRLGVAQQLGQVGVLRHDSLEAAAEAMTGVLADNRADLPVAAFYLLEDVDDPTGRLRALAGHGVTERGAGAPTEAGARWLTSVLHGGERTATGPTDTWPDLAPAPDEVGGGAVHTLVGLPLTPPGRGMPVGVLVLGVSPHLTLDEDYRRFLASVAAQAGGILGDTLVHLVERSSARADRAMSEALQRSMLTEPVGDPDHLEIATRYLPAAIDAEIGGDWYDVFVGRDGATWLVVGDVAGHDQAAAAVMGQVRNLLRGIAFTLQDSPAGALSAVDAAMHGLGVSGLTTAVVLRVEPHAPSGGGRRVRWSNAGHPAPLVFGGTGDVRVLETTPEPLLGAVPDARRTDHELSLPPGTGLLLYTDGLVERRRADLDAGQEWLVQAVATAAPGGTAALCDGLLALVAGHADDDIALLAALATPRP